MSARDREPGDPEWQLADGQLHVLVVDDDADLRKMLCAILLAEDHSVVAAGSAEEALEYLPFHTFQIAFLDHNLPGMEGLTLGEYLRRSNPHMQIALVTGSDDSDLRRESTRHHITFIAKPFEFEQILQVVRDYRAAQEELRLRRLREQDHSWHVPIGDFHEDLGSYFSMPSVPQRIEDQLVNKIKRFLNNLRSVSRYSERDRVAAFAGLLAAEVLGIKLPRTHDGRTFFEEYDQLMDDHGHAREFAPAPEGDEDAPT